MNDERLRGGDGNVFLLNFCQVVKYVFEETVVSLQYTSLLCDLLNV